ncbi:TRAP transporter substrate-binding protein DctP [Nocardiopsis salina]|uniref:TRAP transporter substrate-binding protein DctP n=1 Tax=Nocardiopsis salina TaxID=245836 RepID=UPI00034BCD4D|nr:TRAP transporter substrate-binding protein DctP [Nocardiopsis salina]
MRNRRWAAAAAAVSALTLAACSAPPAPGTGADFEGTIDLSLALGEGSHHHAGAEAFAEELSDLTQGRIETEFYYNNALGGEREVVEGMSIGSVDAGIASTGPMGGFVEEYYLFDLPYLFQDYDHAWAALDGSVGDELAGLLEEEADVRVLSWMENGFRHMTNGVRPVHTPDDLDDMVHRTQESNVQIDTWSQLGANATPLAWPEVYTALQQGVMDSQENPLPTIADVRFHEVQDHLALTQHTYSPAPLMISGDLWRQLSEDDQQAVTRAAEHALPVQREASVEQAGAAVQDLEDEGMQVTRPDLEAFEARTGPVRDTWAPRLGEDLVEDARSATP